MGLEITVQNKTMVARIEGELDHHTAMNVRARLDEAIQTGHIHRLVFDFSELRFMDSSGIGVILGRYKQVVAKHGKVIITGASEHVLRLLTISGIHKIIPIVKNMDDALKISV